MSGPWTPKRTAATNDEHTPSRAPQRTPNLTPNRTSNRTPNRSLYEQTPTKLPAGSINRSFLRTHVKPPDFVALAQEEMLQQQQQAAKAKRNHDDSFVAYNPEKEPIKVCLVYHSLQNRRQALTMLVRRT